MPLDFPNPSRSLDGTRNRVRFWGYVRASEISFFVGADTLENLCPGMVAGELSGHVRCSDRAHPRDGCQVVRKRQGIIPLVCGGVTRSRACRHRSINPDLRVQATLETRRS